MTIGELFQRPIDRHINPVVQVEDADEHEVLIEVNEYVFTDQIANSFKRLIDQNYLDKDPKDTCIWISGFFGSGKSLFLKLLCKIVANEVVANESILDKLVASTDDADVKRALKALKNRKPAKVLSLHMKSEAFEDATIVNILWRTLHRSFGYSAVPWIAEIERSLEMVGLLSAFRTRAEHNEGKSWSDIRDNAMLRDAVLAKALSEVDPVHYPALADAQRAIDETRKSVVELQTPLGFTQRSLALLNEHQEFERLFLGLDEMGQFAADRADFLLELGTLAEEFQSLGKGRLWLAATAQEKLEAVVANFGTMQPLVEKIKDRFKLRVDLTSSNAEEVVRERLLRKSNVQEATLREYLKPYEAWLQTEPILRGLKHDYPRPTLETVIASYPLLPAHFQLIIDFMQGLARDTGGTADRTARGPRALIEVTQDLAKALAPKEIGYIVRADHIYAEMSGSIPSEDADLVAMVDRLEGSPSNARGTLEAAYVLDIIGVDSLPGTATNLEGVLIDCVGGGGSALRTTVTNALGFLTQRAFLREVGAGASLTYRFLKDYQRKIEEDVRLKVVSTTQTDLKSRELIRETLRQFGNMKPSFKGVRTFSLDYVIDPPTFVAGNPEIAVRLHSPLKPLALEEARALSVKDGQPYWLMKPSSNFLDDIRVLVATNDVLGERRSKATTPEEQSQIQRAEGDLATRQDRLHMQIASLLRDGILVVSGLEVPIVADVGAALVDIIVEQKYPALWNAPVLVSEKDLEGVFDSKRPRGGPLEKLGLVENETIVDTGELAKAVLAIAAKLSYEGGAAGGRIVEKLENPPYGYSEMQTRLAISALCASGRLRALGPGQKPLSVGAGLENLLRVRNDFRKLTFEREAPVDEVQLHATIGLLGQSFGRKVAAEPPAVSAALRAEAETLQAAISTLEGNVRFDVPQALHHLQPLKSAVAAIRLALNDAAVIAAAANHGEVLKVWQSTLKPLQDRLTPVGVKALADARELANEHGVEKTMPELVANLKIMLDGPRPWQDYKEVEKLVASIVADVKTKLQDQHENLRIAVGAAVLAVRAECELHRIAEPDRERFVQDAQALDCPGYIATTSGKCSACSSGLNELSDRIDALPAREQKIIAAVQKNMPPQPGGPSPKAAQSFSVREKMKLPRLITSRADIAPFINGLQAEIEKMVDEHGSGTVTA